MANQCNVFTHDHSMFINRPCDGAVIPIYRTFTASPPTVTINIENAGTCPITLIVERGNNLIPIMEVIQPGLDFVMTVEFVTSISVQCSTGGGTCEFLVELDISSCMCC
ncbi:S-Ena type endospore appendage [Aneurinibacillus migulanus]|uniref:S-Ena type endospore appendage n=2 Tax=Aneurinibacillus migulanus TaxID=47500 RepID=UPI000F9EE850|nr:S-Ena type endospore appendage [Aneurinibacillus migulanus]MCP1358898.1 hypothetical protein [Aneurinibacillus migulanus]